MSCTLALAVVGTFDAAYLSITALAEQAPVCGGLGDCATVHASPYAWLFGVPVAILGLAAYLALVALLLILRRGLTADIAFNVLLAVTFIASTGTAFSIYLTYAEVFIIEAICPWCVASALAMSAILVLSVIQVVREPA